MLSDLRYSIRTLWRSRLFTLSAVLTFALGIGANSAVFSVVEAVLIRPLPYVEPDRLVRIWESNPSKGIERGEVSPGSFIDWRARTRAFERMALFTERDWLMSINGQVESVHSADVSPSLFPMLGVAPLLGRTFRPESEQSAPFDDTEQIVISHSLWQRSYGGRADIIGQRILLEGRTSFTVIGVMPQGFAFPARTEAWRQRVWMGAISEAQRAGRWYSALAQVKRGITLESAREELAAIARQIEVEQPATTAGFGVQVSRLDDALVEGARTPLLMMLAVVTGVLLIACANVGSLLLARAVSRRHEVAVRLSLGAHWTRVLRQSVADSLVLVGLGLVVGSVVGFGIVSAFVRMAPAGVPRLEGVGFGGGVLLFSTVAALLSVLFTSLPPLLQARKLDVHNTLRFGGRVGPPASARVLRGWLVGGEVALTLALLVGCVLLLRSFVALRGVDAGFQSNQILTAELRVPANRFPETAWRPWFRLAQHFDDVISNVASLPGVVAAGGTTDPPLTGEASSLQFWLGGPSTPVPDATAQLSADVHIVTPGYFRAMGVPILRGRGLTDLDRFSQDALVAPKPARADHPIGVVLVNEAFVRRHFSNAEPLGESVVLLEHHASGGSIIVGVVGDVRSNDLATPASPAIYVPFGEMPGFRLSMAIRTEGDPEEVVGMLRERIRQIDPQTMISRIRPMSDVVSGALSRPRFNLLAVASFALVALALAAVGIHGIVAFLVANRTREIGVRIALGARASDVIRLVLNDALVPVAIGSAVGCGIALMGVRAMSSMLYGIVSFDPASFVLAILVLGVVALAAAIFPALCASRVDPTVAIRQE